MAAIALAALTPAFAASPENTLPRPSAPGFAPEDETVFASILALAPPGPQRAARALAICDRQLDFQSKIWLHPQFSPEVRKVLDQLPPRQGTIIRAASLYSRDDISWNELANRARQISVAGGPTESDYLYVLTPRYASPEIPEHMAGAFTLSPSSLSSDGKIRGVDGVVSGEFLMDTFGAGTGIDFAAALLRYFHGDLKPPWDTAPGAFNHHDSAALSRFHAELPHFSQRVEHYFKFNNLVDEFQGAGKPVVLFNLDAEVQPGSLKPFPELDKFYRSIAPAVVATTTITDSKGNRWMESRFNRGRIRVIFMLRDGMLTPFDRDYHPAGPEIDLAQICDGSYRTDSSATITRLKMTFGLSNLEFKTNFHRDQDSVETTSTMEAVPDLVAPPGIHKVIDLIAGEFLRVLAQGDGGFKATFSSRRSGNALFHYAGAASAEFAYAPTLEFLARIGDSVADQHSAEVKKEERELGADLFDAFMTDYNDSRAKILALDGNQEDRRDDKAYR